MILGRTTPRSILAPRLAACALVLLASAAQAEGPGRPIARSPRAADGIYAFVSGATGALESSEGRFPIFTLKLPAAGSYVPAMQVGAHMTVGSQPRMNSAILFSTLVSF